MSPTDDAVFTAVQDMLTAYSARDLEGALAHFADDAELVCIGSGPQEKSLGKESLAAHLGADFVEAQSMAVDFPWHRVGARGDVAWVAADCKFTLEADHGLMHIAARLTAVLVRQGGEWKIIQYHLSLPFPREDER